MAVAADSERDAAGEGALTYQVDHAAGAYLPEVHAAIDERHLTGTTHHLHRRPRANLLLEALLHIPGVTHDTVGVDAHEAGFDQVSGDHVGFVCGSAASDEQLDSEVVEARRGNCGHDGASVQRRRRWRTDAMASSTALIM